MKKILLAFVLVTSTLTMVMTEAQARRMGGGLSFGRQSSNIGRVAPMQRSKQPPAANQAQQGQKPAGANQPQAPGQGGRWGGMIGGALLGLGLGALLGHMGIGGDMAGMISTILMIAIMAFAIRYVLNMFRRKQQGPVEQKTAYSSGGFDNYSGNSRTPEIDSALDPAARGASAFQTETATASSVENATWGIPVDFDVPAFLRSAKAYFLRMQVAWDKANTDDLYEFTTPEMFAELKLQIQERGPSPNVTDVVTLDAELLGVETIADEYLASVKFSGTIKESPNAAAEPFAEIWNMSRSVVKGNDGWVLAGIQQTN